MVINIMKEFKEWLDLYGRAWMLRKPTLIKKLFVDNATYHEKPLEKPLKCISEITKYWENVSTTQRNIEFDYEILSCTKNYGIAHWQASFVRNNNERVELDGIFLAYFDDQNKCTNFREWWQSRKTGL